MKLNKTLPALFVLASASLFAKDMQTDDVLAVVNDGSIKPFDQLHADLLNAFPGARIKDAQLLALGEGYQYRLQIRTQDAQAKQVLMDAGSGQILGAQPLS
ncbi:PepSY domain-containing protein [Gallaecimonas xiamenensis]|uniref:Peptidase n=1 Tax=Gallaecimonas xiamenensis 3-C-1 TaxID=745411 RepID=K2JLJ7_9GAMM|nr:hypothetical protein [Gallaecimonas xiamenensis]EKE71414.1 peptidase [Gallaecimonas xiamenensis 3-C-1]